MANPYAWVWRKEKQLYKWTWLRTRELCEPKRKGYLDRRGHDSGAYQLIGKSGHIRGFVGYGIWAVLTVAGYVVPGPSITHAGQVLYISAAYWMPLPCIIAVSLVLYATTDVSRKPATGRSLATPVSQAFLLVPSAGIVMVGIWLAGTPGANTIWGLDNWAPHPSPLIDALGPLSSIIGIILLPLWLAACLWVVFAPFNLAARLFWNNFRAIDGHPYLGPVSTLVSVWAIVIYDAVVSGPGKSFRADTSVGLRVVVSWGGPIVLTALAVIELMWLWRNGIRPREGSLPAPAEDKATVSA